MRGPRTKFLRLIAAYAALAACARPPKGMRRLDSGDLNHEFRLDARRRYLYYVEGGDDIATRLGVVDLETGRRSSYRFTPEDIVAIRPALGEDAVTVAVRDDESDEGAYELLKVDAATGRVLRGKPSDELSEEDFAEFGGSAPFQAQVVDGPPPGVRTVEVRGRRHVLRFFPTAAEPAAVVVAPGGKVDAAYRAADGNWKIEELDPDGVRRTFASFPGEIESMAAVGRGLAVLHQGEGGGPRLLAMVDASVGRVELELPWSDGDSEILGADEAKRLLYIRMDEGDARTCWAVRFDEDGLRAASAYLAAKRGPNVRKLTDTDVMGLVVMGGMLVLLAALVAGTSA